MKSAIALVSLFSCCGALFSCGGQPPVTGLWPTKLTKTTAGTCAAVPATAERTFDFGTDGQMRPFAGDGTAICNTYQDTGRGTVEVSCTRSGPDTYALTDIALRRVQKADLPGLSGTMTDSGKADASCPKLTYSVESL